MRVGSTTLERALEQNRALENTMIQLLGHCGGMSFRAMSGTCGYLTASCKGVGYKRYNTARITHSFKQTEASTVYCCRGKSLLGYRGDMMLQTLCYALAALLSIAAAAHDDLSSSYPFHTSLEARYDLYWKVDFVEKSIQFAVRVNTTGWVGFGLSPNGGMPNSDVVIGWVDGSSGQGYLHVSDVGDIAAFAVSIV